MDGGKTAPDPHRPAGWRRRTDRHRVLTRAEGPRLRQGRVVRPAGRVVCLARRRRQLGAPRQRAGAADVLQEHPCRSEGSGSRLRAERPDPDFGGRRTAPCSLGERNKHVDNHYVWIDPDDTDHLLEAATADCYESGSRAAVAALHQPLGDAVLQRRSGQRVADLHRGWRHAGQRHAGGPSRSRTPDGATNGDWFVVTGGDGFVARIDPNDPNIVYGESQHGGIVRLDRRTASGWASSQSRAAAKRRCASTGNRRS